MISNSPDEAEIVGFREEFVRAIIKIHKQYMKETTSMSIRNVLLWTGDSVCDILHVYGTAGTNT